MQHGILIVVLSLFGFAFVLTGQAAPATTATTAATGIPASRLTEICNAYRDWWYKAAPFPDESALRDLRVAVDSGNDDAEAKFWLSRAIRRSAPFTDKKQMQAAVLLTKQAAAQGLDVAVIDVIRIEADQLPADDHARRKELLDRAMAVLSRGEPEAAIFLGTEYLTGNELGLEKDLAKAEVLLQRAVNQGGNRAYCNLALTQKERGRYSDAIISLRKGAESGDPQAQTVLGDWLINGIVVPRDEAEAELWFRKAAKIGLPGGKMELAKMLLAQDPTRNNPEVLRLLEESAVELQEAQYWLAYVKLYGMSGVTPDPVQAEKMLRELSDHGHSDASYVLGIGLLTGLWTHQDVAAAKVYLKRAADGGKGDAWGMLNLYDHLQHHPTTTQPATIPAR